MRAWEITIHEDARLPEWFVIAKTGDDLHFVADGHPLPAGTTAIFCHPERGGVARALLAPPVPIERVGVNYAAIGTDVGNPVSEAVGTLVHSMDGRCYVKVTETHCRAADPVETRDWCGPVSPVWYRNA